MMFEEVINFLSHPFFILMGGASTLVLICTALCTICLAVKGVIPVWYRLGLSLSKNKIAIFAEANEYNNLKNVLTDSGLFKKKNIEHIDQKSIPTAEEKDLFVLHWTCFKEKIDDVLKIKKDATGLIVYAPQEDGRIKPDDLKKINVHRNVTIVNFRGRLLQDVFVSMITTKRSGK